MIRALFYRREGNLIGFSVSGHAGYADSGQDIVCAAVTSAVEMTSNGITEIAREKATVNVNENEVQLKVEKSSAENALLLQSMRLQLELLQEQFPKNIRIQDMEV
jgi:uncharacterized protein YsxB (DUF464 family)